MKHVCLFALFLSACTVASTAPLDDSDETTAVEHHAACTFGASRWGLGDQAGQSNTQTPAKAKEAAKLIKKGKRWSLAHESHVGMPVLEFGNLLLGYQMTLLGPIPLDASTVGQEEQVHSEIGQVGTQIDTLGHMCFRSPGQTINEARCYGGYTQGDIFTPAALTSLGIEQIKPYFTRGWLLDVARAVNGGQRLAPGQPVTAAMIKTTLQKQKLKLEDIDEGDVVLIRTGQEELWDTDPIAYYSATPGLDLSAMQLLMTRCIGNVGVDNWPVEVQPATDVDPDGSTVPVHKYNLSVAGIPQMESLALGELANDLAAEFADDHDGDAYRFAFILNPIPLRGATGSPAAPVAMK